MSLLPSPFRALAFTAALCCLLPLTGCSPYSSVSERHPVFKSQTPTGRAFAQVLGTRAHSEVLLGKSLDYAAAASQQLRARPGDATARGEYNFATSRVFDILRSAKLRPWDAPVRVPSPSGEWLLTFQNDSRAELERGQIEMQPADRIAFRGSYVGTHTRKDGLGAPLVVANGGHDFRQTERLGQNQRTYYGMTGLLRFQGRRCILTTEDPLAQERVTFAGHSFPLAADFTAPLALGLSKETPFLFGLERLLRPQKYAHTARIARLQPYDPAKVPVICVHGILDSPATWVPLINAMRGDAAIRQRYQFWFYSYPSGYPYPHSAAIMRAHLDAIHLLYPGHKREILIGHSMGGLIARTMITESGLKIWHTFFSTPPERLAIPHSSRELLTDAFIFHPRPEVSRVIFIATPHRGSDFATGWLGRLGARLVRVPAYLLRLTAETRRLTTLDTPSLRLGFLPNSIATLTPRDPFLQAIDRLPLAPGIPAHSIMGDRGKGGHQDHTQPVSSDGYVPYWSSHLQGTASELIVPSGHSVHQNAQAIEEVRRILHRAARP